MEKLRRFIKKLIQFLLNPRFMLCFGIAWLITNGWSYILFALGTFFEIRWMQAVGGGYLTFLWLPISPEKILTIAISIWLLKVFFPNDQKTLAVLKSMHEKVRMKKREKKQDKE